MNKHHKYLLLAALPLFVAVALAIHYPAFDAPTYYDSFTKLEANEHVFASGDLAKVIQIFPQRPVSMVSFYLNYLIWGMNPFYFRVVNAIILGMTAFIAAFTFILILEISSATGSGRSTDQQLVSLFLGLLFVVHPVQLYYVDYIWQRMGLLSCFFYISALAAYLAVRDGRIHYTAAGYALCLVLFCLALASKENAITLPAVLILAEIAFFRSGWKGLLKRAGVFVAILIPLLGILSLLERPHGAGAEALGIFATIAKYYEDGNLTMSQVVISQCRVLFSYLTLILVPVPSNVHYATAHVIFSSPLESPAIAASVLSALAIFGAAVYLLRRRPLTGFGLLFFLVGMLPESFLVPLYLFRAYRVILPMFGLLLVLADGLLEIWAKIRPFSEQKSYLGPLAAGLLATMVVALMGSVTISKAKLWQDPVAFWTDIVEGLPPPAVNVEKETPLGALKNLGVALMRQERASEAVVVLRRAAEIDPRLEALHVLLGMAYDQLGNISEAESTLKRAAEIDPASENAEFALGQLYLKQDRLSEAWLHMKRTIELAPSDPRGFNEMGTLLLRQGNAAEAASYFRKAIEVSPWFPEAHYNLGEVLEGVGLNEEAAEHFKRALALKRGYWQAHNSLGMVLAKSGSVKEAETQFREALVVSPRNWRIHNNLGVLLAKSGRLREAEEHFENALRHNPEDISVKNNLERVRNLIDVSSGK